LSLRSDLDSVGEVYTRDDLRQLVVTIKATPAFLGGLGELEVRIPTKSPGHSEMMSPGVPT
jgi:hypothetical protein